MIIPITNKSKNFYSHLGKVFGSREIEKLTSDRFYDDDSKTWYLYYKSGAPDTFVSLKDNVIKNIWSENEKHLIEVLKEIKKEVRASIVTDYFKDYYIKAGYKIVEKTYKNFVKIRGDYNEKED